MKISQPVIEIIKRIDEDHPTIYLERENDPQWYNLKIFKNESSKEYLKIEIYLDPHYGFTCNVYWMNPDENNAVGLAVKNKIERDREKEYFKQRQEFIDWMEIDK